MPEPSYTLGDIASRVGGTLHGDPRHTVTGIKPLDEAGPEHLSFVAKAAYRRMAAASRAGGLIATAAEVVPGRNVIVVDRPYAALASAMRLFVDEPRPAPGIDPRTSIDPSATIAPDASVGPFVVVGARSIVGAGVVLLPGVVLGDQVEIGAGSVLHPGVVVYGRTVIGSGVVVHAGSVLGSDGFGYAEADRGRAKIPQIGNVVIEDEVEIGACVTIDRATFGTTRIGRGTKIDNLVQIGHNVTIGEGSVIVAQTGLAGSTRIGRSVTFAGRSGAAGHLAIGDGAVIGAESVVVRDLEPGAFVLGFPAIDHGLWKREQAALRRLPDLLRRVARLEADEEARRPERGAPGRARQGVAGGRRRGARSTRSD